MSTPLRLIIFDVDGTLVDSQVDIVASMDAAFRMADQDPPHRQDILSIVGLSLDVAIAQLRPGLSQASYDVMVQGYKDTYHQRRIQLGTKQSSPLYPGIKDMLAQVGAVPEFLLGVATGKSRRGLDALLAGHGLEKTFLTQQVADYHPSKPHPAMLLAAMDEMGVLPEHTVMIGDTEFDMAMARAAGVRSIGVSWGYHTPDRLDGADRLVHEVPDLTNTITEFWG